MPPESTAPLNAFIDFHGREWVSADDAAIERAARAIAEGSPWISYPSVEATDLAREALHAAGKEDPS